MRKGMNLQENLWMPSAGIRSTCKENFGGKMADILLMEVVENTLNRALMRERVLKDRSNPLEDLLPKQVKPKYHFEPETIYALCRILHYKLQ